MPRTTWTETDIALRDDIRVCLFEAMLVVRELYGDRITDDALRLANWDYSAMRTAERNNHDL